jgi:hypothetical protein
MYANIMGERAVVEASGDNVLRSGVEILISNKNLQIVLCIEMNILVMWILIRTHFYNRPLYDQIFNPIPECQLTVLAGKVLCQRPQR